MNLEPAEYETETLNTQHSRVVKMVEKHYKEYCNLYMLGISTYQCNILPYQTQVTAKRRLAPLHLILSNISSIHISPLLKCLLDAL